MHCLKRHPATYLVQETVSKFTEVWLLVVDRLLKVSKKLISKPVDLFNVTKYGGNLLCWEHLGSLAGVLQVTLATISHKPYTTFIKHTHI